MKSENFSHISSLTSYQGVLNIKKKLTKLDLFSRMMDVHKQLCLISSNSKYLGKAGCCMFTVQQEVAKEYLDVPIPKELGLLSLERGMLGS